MTPLTRRALAAIILAPLLQSSGFAGDGKPPWKVLLVVAHPDDEYYFAGTVYRLAQELNATVDQVIITNGEGGYRYSALAEKIYGVPLTDEQTGRSRLPEIRRKEVLAAGKILGVRHHYFLNELDQKFTLDAGEALDQIWNCRHIRTKLHEILTKQHYDFIFTMLPRGSTHGHHQAATLLALEVANSLDEENRPVVLGAEPSGSHEPAEFQGLTGASFAQTASPTPSFTFDRRQSFGYQNALRYDIVVHWVISEHKSQGMFQNEVGKHDVEHFWRFVAGPPDGESRTKVLADQLQRNPNQELRKVAQQ